MMHHKETGAEIDEIITEEKNNKWDKWMTVALRKRPTRREGIIASIYHFPHYPVCPFTLLKLS